MKLRSFKLLMFVILIMQTISFTSVFAADDLGINHSFSQTGGYTVTYASPTDKQNNAIVYGQYGKDINDASIRMYTLGGTYYNNDAQTKRNDQYITMNTNLGDASSGEYIHVSFEYLRENLNGSLTVKMNMIDSVGTVLTDRELTFPLTTAATTRILRNSKNKSGSTHYDAREVPGAWMKYDFYFSPDSNEVPVFRNGVLGNTKVLTTDWGTKNFSSGVKKITALKFYHTLDTVVSPSAVQIDNVVVEKVSTVPASAQYTNYGEALTFDDNMAFFAVNGHYHYGSLMGSTAYNRFYNYTGGGIGDYGIEFQNYTTYTYETPSGVYNKPVWDKSLHVSIPADSTTSTGMSAVRYMPSFKNLGNGEYGHLSLTIANAKSDCSAGVTSAPGNMGSKTLVEMNSNTGTFKFIGVDDGIKWVPQKWYKIDAVIKRNHGVTGATGTYADIYLDGVKVVENRSWTASVQLTTLGSLYFSDAPGSDYYVDDISYGPITDADLSGYCLSSTSATYVDSKEKTVAIDSDGDIATYLAENTAKNITVYNGSGLVVYDGVLTSDTTIKVSNNFSGMYYNVGYTTPKIAIGEVVYNADDNVINTSVIGYGIKENYSDADDANIPQNGTVIIALYSNDTLESVKAEPYENIYQLKIKPASLNADSVSGKTVKVFVVDSETDLTPLVVNKEIKY